MDIWTKRHIRNYCSDPSEANDSKYSKYYQRIRRAIRKEDEATRAKGGTIDWGYMLWNLDWYLLSKVIVSFSSSSINLSFNPSN